MNNERFQKTVRKIIHKQIDNTFAGIENSVSEILLKLNSEKMWDDEVSIEKSISTIKEYFKSQQEYFEKEISHKLIEIIKKEFFGSSRTSPADHKNASQTSIKTINFNNKIKSHSRLPSVKHSKNLSTIQESEGNLVMQKPSPKLSKLETKILEIPKVFKSLKFNEFIYNCIGTMNLANVFR